MEQLVAEAYSSVLELEIDAEFLVGTQIYKLATGFDKAKEEAARIQL